MTHLAVGIKLLSWLGTYEVLEGINVLGSVELVSPDTVAALDGAVALGRARGRT